MNTTSTSCARSARRLPSGAVRQAVRLSFAQSMLGAIYGASTGGMFLIGYALRLGADNVQIGLMSTIPMLCIVVQLATAALVERGVSRRRLTFFAALGNVSGWALIILIPYAAAGASDAVRVRLLIGVIAAVTLFAFVSGNARGSWFGDLVPARFRGTFFGRTALYGGIIASLFAVLEGGFLDAVKAHGLAAFSTLFGFGMCFGLANAFLFLPQKDVPVERHEHSADLWRMIRATLSNRSLMTVALFTTLWALQGVAGPFYATYMLRDLKMPFLGVGLVNSVFMVSFLASGPFWGRVVDRWGCRPVLTACTSVFGPIQLVWLWVDSPLRAYEIVSAANIVAGACVGGVSVALNTLVYKVTPSAGRSVQLAVYSILIVLLAAPLPTIGGHVPDWLAAIGLPRDLRVTFYIAGGLILLSALVSRAVPEPGSCRARRMLRELGSQWLALVVR